MLNRIIKSIYDWLTFGISNRVYNKSCVFCKSTNSVLDLGDNDYVCTDCWNRHT